MAKRKQHTKEFKLEAVRLANEPNQSFLQVSKNLGISDSALHRWARELGTQGSVAFPGHGKADLTTEQEQTVKRKKHGHLEVSVFRLGLDHLQDLLAHPSRSS